MTFRIVAYPEDWPRRFAAIRGQLSACFDEPSIEIEHIGRTAVPGMCAKPVVDVLLGASSLALIEAAIPRLEATGYASVRKYEAELPLRRYFVEPESPVCRVHMHGVCKASQLWNEDLGFRDALRADPSPRDTRARLKLELARIHASNKAAYTAAKAPFISRILAAVGQSTADGVCSSAGWGATRSSPADRVTTRSICRSRVPRTPTRQLTRLAGSPQRCCYDALNMSYLIICTVALLASALTFFSGFGLGTLLLPAFALLFPVEQAVALTAIVHFLNGLFKLGLTGRHADRSVLLRFGAPAILMSFVGAWALTRLAGVAPVIAYSAFGRPVSVTLIELVIGLLLVLFALMELVPRLRDLSFAPRYLPLGGVLSGFFGGLSGMQGALRSAFLSRAGLSKQAFIATGVVIACLIDIARLSVYSTTMSHDSMDFDYGVLAAAVLAAFAGAALGNRYLKKVTMPAVQRIVAAMLLVVALGLMSGLL
jgi:GrpB-like predicted nucleotidyltransferase (UPF0157 family)/uncharacterized membrane protein YfcA